MKLILENIGKIKKAEIDLDHQLTVFFGPNNTGKTYVSYCLYGLSRIAPFGNALEEIVNLISLDFKELYKKGILKINLLSLFLPIREILRRKYSESFKKSLPELFGNYESDFSDSSIILSFLNNDSDFEKFIGSIPVTLKYVGSPVQIEMHNEDNGNVIIKTLFDLSNESENLGNYGDEQHLKIELLQYILNVAFDSAFFIPAERIGISIFGKELILSRFSKTNLRNKNNEFISYSMIIDDAIKEQFQMSAIKRGISNHKFLLLAEEIESEVLGGGLSVNEAGDVFYSYDNKKALSILQSASNIKSLSSLVFYLRNSALKGQILFIDEPEINLHPENQIKIARILAQIANLGIKVYVSTHSDYIIREFNNLMMLGKDDPEKERLIREYGYRLDETLNYKTVGAYLFNDGLAKQIEVTPEGFDAETIDETINRQNKASNDIRWTLFES